MLCLVISRTKLHQLFQNLQKSVAFFQGITKVHLAGLGEGSMSPALRSHILEQNYTFQKKITS